MLNITLFSIAFYLYPLCFNTIGLTTGDKVEIVFIGNEGLAIVGTDTDVIIDGFYSEDFGIYGLPDPETRDSIMYHKGRYGNIKYIIISHVHDDHFDPEQVLKYMRLNPHVTLISTQQVIDRLKDQAESQHIVKRCISVSEVMQIDNLTLFPIRHVRKHNYSVNNLGTQIQVRSQFILHLGDAEDRLENFKPYSFIKKSTMAFLPIWFLVSEKGVEVINWIMPGQVYGIHAPRNYQQLKILTNEAQVIYNKKTIAVEF